jgi:aquaporin-4
MIAVAHGAAVGLMVYAFGQVSGAHINPAVTISMLVTRRIGARDAAGYIIFQILGATLAALVHMMILPQGAAVNFGTQGGPSELLGFNAFSGVAVEAILTFFLVTVIFMTAVSKKASPGFAGLAIGGMIFLIHVIGVPLTGASVNPARTLGPAIISDSWDFHWIYWVGPMLGAVIAGLVMSYVFLGEKPARRSERKKGR